MTQKVLIADDSAFARRALRQILETRGLECVEAKDGQEALAVWREHHPALVLLDLNMPKTTGYQVLEAMKQEGSESVVIVISADVQPKARERVSALGARAMVKKPLDKAKVDTILAMVEERMAELTTPAKTPRSVDLAEALNQETLDALTEIVNIGMGRAAAALAEVLGTFLEISVPSPQSLADYLEAHLNSDSIHSALLVQQAFTSDLRGEAIAVFDQKQLGELRSLLSSDAQESTDNELVLEMANILIGAAITSIASQLSSAVRFGRPSILGRGRAAVETLGQLPEARCHLVITIGISVEGREFGVTLLLVLPASEHKRLLDALNTFMQNAIAM